MLVYSLGILAYVYDPINENDLTRYMDFASQSNSMDFEEALMIFNSLYPQDYGVPIYVFIQWVLGQLNLEHMLPMISVMVVYGVSFYITSDLSKKFNKEYLLPYIIVLQMCLLPFLSIAGNIRNICAFSLVILAVYFDIVLRKRKLITLCLYIMPLLIHSSALVLIFARLLICVKRQIRLLMVAIVVFLPQLVQMLYNLRNTLTVFGTVGEITNLFILKINLYLNDDKSMWAQAVANSNFQIVNKFVLCSLAVILCILIFSFIDKFLLGNLSAFLNYAFILCTLTLSTLWVVTPLYWRFACTYCIVIGIIIFPLFDRRLVINVWGRLAKYGIFLYGPICLALNIYIGRVMVNYVDWITKFFVTNVFTMLFQVLSF